MNSSQIPCTILYPTEKKKVLVDDYSIAVTESLERSVNSMCDYSTYVENKGFQKGMQQGMQQEKYGNIRTLMKNMNWSPVQAMSALGIPEEERAKYLEMLKQ